MFKTRLLSPSFGLVIEPGTTTDPLALDQDELTALFREYRTLYFRGWNFSLDAFRTFSQRYSANFSTYEGGGFRFKELDRGMVDSDKTIMTTTGHTQGFAIPLHGEMHYMGTPPEMIWFYCKVPGGHTGQTTVADGFELARRLSPEVIGFFQGRKIRYSRFLPDGQWQTSFMTGDITRVKAICKQQQVDCQFDEEKGLLQTNYTVDPFPNTGIGVGPRFINNLLNIVAVEWAFDSGWVKQTFTSDFGERCPMVVRMDDGTKIPGPIIAAIQEAAEAVTLNVEWEPGEVLMIDNLSVLHGRRESANPAREIFVRMGDYQFEAVPETPQVP